MGQRLIGRIGMVLTHGDNRTAGLPNGAHDADIWHDFQVGDVVECTGQESWHKYNDRDRSTWSPRAYFIGPSKDGGGPIMQTLPINEVQWLD